MDKGSLSALRLAKLIGVQWRSAYSMLRKLHVAMAHRDSLYRPTDLIEIDDTYLGGNKTGKAGRGSGRTPVLITIGTTDEGKPGFAAIETLDSMGEPHIEDFARRRLQPTAGCHADAFSFLRGLAAHITHIPKVTSPEKADE